MQRRRRNVMEKGMNGGNVSTPPISFLISLDIRKRDCIPDINAESKYAMK